MLPILWFSWSGPVLAFQRFVWARFLDYADGTPVAAGIALDSRRDVVVAGTQLGPINFGDGVRGFQQDLDDAREFLRRGLVDRARFEPLVTGIPDAAYAKYPSLSRCGVERAVIEFLTTMP